MRIFAYEHVTGGGLAGAPLPPRLAGQGGEMLAALVADLASAGAQVSTTRDARLAPCFNASVECRWVTDANSWRSAWELCVAETDGVWVVAPETDRILERLSRRVQDTGARLLGSAPSAVAVAASKLATYRRLREASVMAVNTWPAQALGEYPAPPWVLKPDDGAGCEDTRVLRDENQLQRWRRRCTQPSRYVAQPLLAGEPLSLSVVCYESDVRVLSCNRQDVTRQQDVLRFNGVRVEPRADLGVWRGLARAVATAIPGLWGYVGIDLLATRTGPLVLEVNPRLTLGYTDIHRLLGVNPAGLVLRSAQRKPPSSGVGGGAA